ncbi:hypothetical protein GCM10022402_13690 [Salinactinospora qingdaonensis]|uniref:Uncharacterized protein n=1 Tax=Salinactinospora qingdaonensis TaxID=702744 RepID=A0ABP7FA45_9ACTN
MLLRTAAGFPVAGALGKPVEIRTNRVGGSGRSARKFREPAGRKERG